MAANVVSPIILQEDDQSDEESDVDSDLEIARMTIEGDYEAEREAEDQGLFLKGFSTGADAQMPPEGVIVHKGYRTAHKATEDGEAACGLAVSDISYEFTVDPADLFGCKLCWRLGCAPWVQSQTDVADSEGEEVQMFQADAFEDPSPVASSQA